MTHQIVAGSHRLTDQVLTPQAIDFLVKLHRAFNPTRASLLQRRSQKQQELNAGKRPTLLAHDDPAWRIAPLPADLLKRTVEITGPTDAKMVINALNSGADVFMADFEDANVPTWSNLIEGQVNLSRAIDKRLTYESPEGKQYRLHEKTAVLMVRPRGWHLPEKHLLIDGEPISGSLFDFGLYFFHNARRLLEKGSGPYFYLAKLENHLEARLWNDVFTFSEKALGIPAGTIKATVLIETILAAFEMDAILFELKEYSAGLNAGRWDYIFSIIKKFQADPSLVFPDRAQITMTAPFMHAYTELLIKTCHSRGAHAMGGMAAFIPSRKDSVVNERALAKVREDKVRESTEGFDGTWVAHPDLVPLAKEVFTGYLGSKLNQIERQLPHVDVKAQELLDFAIPGTQVTEEGVRLNIRVAMIYIESWLRGTGAVGINNLMEDAATAEISRAQLWQWVHHPKAHVSNHSQRISELYPVWRDEEYSLIKQQMGPELFSKSKLNQAKELIDRLVLSPEFADFLTLPAYDKLEV